MKQTDEFRRFVKEHAGDDLTRLLLSASRYPSIDVPFAVDQIASRRQIKEAASMVCKRRFVISFKDIGRAMFI